MPPSFPPVRRPSLRGLGLLCPLFLGTALSAQPVLLPSIGLATPPADQDAVCALPHQTPPITSVGPSVGATAADFTLYDLDGNAFNLGQALTTKPVLMIAGSWTCPVFRNKVSHINNVTATFGAQVDVVVVYTVEAHPIVDISPYFGAVNPGQTNLNAGITHRQPTTYGERKALVRTMLDSMVIHPPIYIDGPCNPWWDHYGPAPNIAYLVGMDGTIAAKHAWYHKFPDDITCDLQRHLGLPPDCDPGDFTGSFTFELTTNDTVYGPAGSTVTASGLITNPTANDVQVRVFKIQTNLPAGWESSLCLDVCYLPHVDTALIVVPAGDTQDFHYYFYTNGTPGTGRSRIGFRNVNDTNNAYAVFLTGITHDATGIEERGGEGPLFILYPNPADGPVWITTDEPYDRVDLHDAAGRRLMELGRARSIPVEGLASGMYLVRLWDRGVPLPGTARLVVR